MNNNKRFLPFTKDHKLLCSHHISTINSVCFFCCPSSNSNQHHHLLHILVTGRFSQRVDLLFSTSCSTPHTKVVWYGNLFACNMYISIGGTMAFFGNEPFSNAKNITKSTCNKYNRIKILCQSFPLGYTCAFESVLKFPLFWAIWSMFKTFLNI